MSASEFSRRNFNRLSAAAVGGLMAGSLAGCNPQPAAAATKEQHVCRGLNTCKGQGGNGANACAGQGTCSTVTDHGCSTENACKGQGGCSKTPGQNDCKGKGGCRVPLENHAWGIARELFEAKMKAEGKTFGAAPANAEK